MRFVLISLQEGTHSNFVSCGPKAYYQPNSVSSNLGNPLVHMLLCIRHDESRCEQFFLVRTFAATELHPEPPLQVRHYHQQILDLSLPSSTRPALPHRRPNATHDLGSIDRSNFAALLDCEMIRVIRFNVCNKSIYKSHSNIPSCFVQCINKHLRGCHALFVAFY